LAARANERTAYTSRWGTRLLKELDAGRPLPRTYPYPIEVWELGGKQLWIALGGEVVVDYALRFKDRYGAETWISGYANDVMAYIPTLRVLKEGGYEGNTSMMVYGMPAERWGTDVEEIIAAGVDRVLHPDDIAADAVPRGPAALEANAGAPVFDQPGAAGISGACGFAAVGGAHHHDGNEGTHGQAKSNLLHQRHLSVQSLQHAGHQFSCAMRASAPLSIPVVAAASAPTLALMS